MVWKNLDSTKLDGTGTQTSLALRTWREDYESGLAWVIHQNSTQKQTNKKLDSKKKDLVFYFWKQKSHS